MLVQPFVPLLALFRGDHSSRWLSLPELAVRCSSHLEIDDESVTFRDSREGELKVVRSTQVLLYIRRVGT